MRCISHLSVTEPLLRSSRLPRLITFQLRCFVGRDTGKIKACKSAHRMLTVTEAFVVVQTAEEAVDRLAALHERATGALNQALKQYLKDRVEPDAEQRALFRYPELRLTYHCHGEVPQTTRAYAKVQLPGTYSVTVTHPSAFRKYLLEQLVPLMHDFTVTVEVGRQPAEHSLPVRGRAGRRTGRLRRDRRRPWRACSPAPTCRPPPMASPMACTTGKTPTRCRWHCSMRPASTSPSRRLVHYTGSDWRHVQPWILLTNYHRYVDQFILPWPGATAQRPAFYPHGAAGQRDDRQEHGPRRSVRRLPQAWSGTATRCRPTTCRPATATG